MWDKNPLLSKNHPCKIPVMIICIYPHYFKKSLQKIYTLSLPGLTSGNVVTVSAPPPQPQAMMPAAGNVS